MSGVEGVASVDGSVTVTMEAAVMVKSVRTVSSILYHFSSNPSFSLLNFILNCVRFRIKRLCNNCSRKNDVISFPAL